MSDQNFGPEITSRYLSPLHSPSESRCERSTGPRLRSSTLRRPNPFRRRRRCSPCRRNNAGQLRLVPYSAVRNSLCRDGPRAALTASLFGGAPPPSLGANAGINILPDGCEGIVWTNG